MFQAPECFDGRGSFPSDVYSIGLTALHLATNAAPWSHLKATSNVWLSIYISKHTHPLPASLPGWLVHIISACIARDPVTRPDPMGLLKALKHVSKQDALAMIQTETITSAGPAGQPLPDQNTTAVALSQAELQHYTATGQGLVTVQAPPTGSPGHPPTSSTSNTASGTGVATVQALSPSQSHAAGPAHGQPSLATGANIATCLASFKALQSLSLHTERFSLGVDSVKMGLFDHLPRSLRYALLPYYPPCLSSA